jgi:hypothetical protein
MANLLRLTKARARGLYFCSACKQHIPINSVYFRHDPHVYYGHEDLGQHWCYKCIVVAEPRAADPQSNTKLWIPAVQVSNRSSGPKQQRLQPVQLEIIGVGKLLAEQILKNPDILNEITPDQLEEFVCDRLYDMGLEPKRIGPINSRDGGVDIVFWPRSAPAFPFLGAAQVKHHREQRRKVGVGEVRDFAGVLAGHPFNAGILVTNTSFSPDAEWFARERAKLMRLRDLSDIRRWAASNYFADAEWREIPSSIELSRGVYVQIR